jgi:iron complex transport system permease protein
LKRAAWIAALLGLLLLGGALLGLALGPVRLDFHTLLSAMLLHGDAGARTLVWDLRAPRVAAALVVGACLGVAGHLLQHSTRSPLGDPQLFGLGGGAAVVMALTMAGLLRANTWGLFGLSVLASLACAALITFFASRRGLSPARMSLIGVSLSALSAALVTGILAGARVFGAQPLNFLGGSFANRGWSDVLPALPFFALGLLLALPALGSLNMLALGDEVAANMGAAPARTRALAIAAAGVLSGAAVAVAGLVGFVGLLVPHLARLMVGHDVRPSLLVSLLLGAAFMLYADQLARLAFIPTEVPVGMISAVLGAPLMIYVARRTRWS